MDSSSGQDRRKAPVQPDAEHVYGVIKRMKIDEPEVAEQLEGFFDLFLGFGFPMTFSAASLQTLDEAFPSLMEQLDEEAGGTEAEGEGLMLLIQACGFWLGTMLIEHLGGRWEHDDEAGSLVVGMDGAHDDAFDPFDPFVRKANVPRTNLVKEVEKATGISIQQLMDL